MNLLRSWVLALTSASAAAALAKLLTPDGPVKKVTAFLCGIMLAGVLLYPLKKVDISVLSVSLAEYRQTVAELTEDIESQEKQLLRTYIEDRAAAYILDEAHRLGLSEITVSVRAEWSCGCWIPVEVRLSAECPESIRQTLCRNIESELGIPAERQLWNGC